MKGPGTRDGFRAQQLVYARRKLEWDRLARRFKDRPVGFKDHRGGDVLLHPARAGVGGARADTPWRVTWFDPDGTPGGHAFAKTHAEGVAAARAYGAKLETASEAS